MLPMDDGIRDAEGIGNEGTASMLDGESVGGSTVGATVLGLPEGWAERRVTKLGGRLVLSEGATEGS